MHVEGVGIVYWDPTISFCYPVIIPGTGYRRRRDDRDGQGLDSDVERSVGEVTNHIVLEGYIIFITDLNKIFSYRTIYPRDRDPLPKPIELTTIYSKLPSPVEIRDIQGSFRSFAVFAQSGSIVIASSSFLDTLPADPSATSVDHPAVNLVPQADSIVSIAFGDHHFHALHKNGTISTYGTEPGRSGAFGLGLERGLLLRGAKLGIASDWKLDIDEARTVWFEPLMSSWLYSMYRRSPSMRLLHMGHAAARKAYGDYFDREGARWENGVTAEGELGAYFVVKVSAGGWHSAALVLVDEDKAEQARKKHIVNPAPDKTTLNKSEDQPQNMTETPPDSWTSWILTFFLTFARWFLGLTARDLARAGTASIQNRPPERRIDPSHPSTTAAAAAVVEEPLDMTNGVIPNLEPDPELFSAPDGVEYTWTGQPAPELRGNWETGNLWVE
jgi:SCF-associated factor 1